MVPVYTRVLSQGEYGDLDIILIVSTVLFVLADLQFLAGFSRLYLEYYRAGRGPRLVGTIIVVRLIAGSIIPGLFVIAGLLGYLQYKFIPSFTIHSTAWMLAALTVPLSLTYDILLLQSRMLRYKAPFAMGEVFNMIVASIASVLLVILWNWGIAGIVLGLV